MPPKNLPNHLRTYRRRAGFSQLEVTVLLGGKTGGKGSRLSRYERFRRVPDLATALALQLILGTPVSDLFPGVYEQVGALVAGRAAGLRERLRSGRPPAPESPKLRLLDAMVQQHPFSPPSDDHLPPSTTDPNARD